MTDLSQLFLYVPGVLIFLIATTQVRDWIQDYKPGSNVYGIVKGCNHIVKKDKKDRDVYNYYNVTIEYHDPRYGHMTTTQVKSATEYAVSQPVKVYLNDKQPTIGDAEETPLFHPVIQLLGGALLILLAFFQNQGSQVPAMVCLSLILTGAGASMLVYYFRLKKQHLIPLEATITKVFSRQISKETKILRGSKFTYYPIVSYELDGQNYLRRCKVNSSGEKSFPVGDKLTLYLNPETKAVSEKNAHIGMALAGAVLLVSGVLSGLSIISVVL